MFDAAFFSILLVFAAILGLAALGGMYSERSGIINIGLEGKMLVGACITALVAQKSQNPLLGVLAGVGAAVLLSLGHYLLTQTYRIEHIVAGMAVNLFAYGATNFIGVGGFITPGQSTPFFPVMVFVALAAVAVGLSIFMFRTTRFGLHLLAVGEDPNKARITGLDPAKVRLKALLVCGVLCGLSGALIVSNSGNFSDNMTAGRGFIALAALILGGWRPLTVALACVAFAAFDAMQLVFQGQRVLGLEVPNQFWTALPYLITLFALAGLVSRSRAPAGLGKA